MLERSQSVRPTQFITSYGPGAILEGLRGPRLIPGFAESRLFGQVATAAQYEILEPALRQILQDGRIFRLPTNADLGWADSRYIYETRVFPRWSICARHSLLYRAIYNTTKSCPECPRVSKEEAWLRAREQAISFVLACPDGHIDDVDWVRLLHAERGCNPEVIRWRGAGGPLKMVRLECPKCGASQRLADLYHREHRCAGRFVWKEEKEECRTPARISQRAASDLYLPETTSALTLPREDSELHRALHHDAVLAALSLLLTNGDLSPDAHAKLLGLPNLPAPVAQVLGQATREEIARAARAVLDYNRPLSAEDARGAELRVLREAAEYGKPLSPNFEIDPSAARVCRLGGLSLRVTPVNRLRLVMAQIGYRRLGGKLVTTEHLESGSTWYPGVELFGEGLFLQLLTPPQTNGSAYSEWQRRFDQSGKPEDHPMMVWWHTLSHRLIRALAVDSGYSAASVRERLYLSGDEGGLLVYAVQPGGDGTLGGLIALTSCFDRVLAAALQGLDSCSNDPLCGDQRIARGRHNGACCYACGLLSETSCELRNHSLDRRILIETVLG